MERKIKVQIHDYDACGRYLITEEGEITNEERVALKHKARESVITPVDWSSLHEDLRHIVYYAELLDKDGEIWYVAIFMHGEAYPDDEFYRVFTQKDIGYVGAFHKRV